MEVEVVMGKKRWNSHGCLVSDSQIAGIKPPDEPPDGSFCESRSERNLNRTRAEEKKWEVSLRAVALCRAAACRDERLYRRLSPV